MKKLLLAVSLALACVSAIPAFAASTKAATTSSNPITTALNALLAIPLPDLQNALSIANANNDPMAAQCFTALIPIVTNLQGVAVAPVGKIGAFTAFEKTRVLARTIQAGIPDSLNIACAPVIMDSQTTVLKLGALIGLAVPAVGPIKLGVGGAIAGFSAATAAIPK